MPESSKRAITITISCLSGGSGKTTTSLNVATMLAQKGKTLAVDFDPQSNLSQWLGWTDLSDEATIAEAILPDPDRLPITEILKPPTNEDRQGMLWLAPADYSLSRAAEVISPSPGRELFLKRAIKPVLEDYEFIRLNWK